MKLHFKLFIVLFLALFLASCVKNKPFLDAYSVPASFIQENNDSSALARVIMAHGLANYLAKSVNMQLDPAIVDSLWLNRGDPFTREMVPDFRYTDSMLNRMKTINLASNTGDADSIRRLADSVAFLSQFRGVTASNGVAGVGTQNAPVSAKRLFNENGMELSEVWFNAMLGANFMRSAFGNLSGPGQNVTLAWDLAYNYMGFPIDYDPNLDYNNSNPVRLNRPLGIAALFPAVKNDLNAGAKIYEEFRRAKASAVANDARVNAISIANIVGYTELTLAVTTIFALDSAKQVADPVAKLHYLSKAHGLMRALKSRIVATSLLSETAYWQIRAIMDTNFYTLIQDGSYTKINEARNLLLDAYTE